jgi:hypothetical protein
VPNSQSWKHITRKWQNFVIEARNILLKLTLDGVNPFGDLSSCHSTWLVVLLNYNLLACLVTKHYFIIILGKEFVTFGSRDVCLEPLIDELVEWY